jgi:outer membrane immunogenic protein
MRILIGLLTVLASSLLLRPAPAQELNAKTAPPRLPELAVAYDLIGSNAPAGQCGCFFLNGGSVTAAIPVPVKRLWIAGQVSATHAGNIGTPHDDLTLLTYMIGFRYTPSIPSRHVSLFAQGLIGAGHASGSLVGGSNPGSQNAGISLAGSVGGGLDLRWKRAISIRAIEVEYQPTTVDNHTTALQNNYRISAGLVFHLAVH